MKKWHLFMTMLLNTVTRYLEHIEWTYTVQHPVNEPYPVVVVNLQTDDNIGWLLLVQVRQPLNQIAVYSLFPVVVPPERCAVVAELVARLNFWLGVGNFELHFETGSLRFRTSVEVGEQTLMDDLLDPLILINGASVSKYLTYFNAVIAQERSPDEILTEIDSLMHTNQQIKESPSDHPKKPS